MKEVFDLFPELIGILIHKIPPTRDEKYYRGLPLSDRFYSALIKSELCDKDLAELVTRTIIGYLELPILIDNLSDDERKDLKMKTEPSLKSFLKETKLHRLRINQVTFFFSEFIPEILFSDEMRIENGKYQDITDANHEYNAWSTAERVSFLQKEFIPFVVTTCTKFIEKYS